jgi:hypothetical protein
MKQESDPIGRRFGVPASAGCTHEIPTCRDDSRARPAKAGTPNLNFKPALGCLFTVLFCSTASAQLSRISVQGNHFVTAEGQTIVFHGLATSDPDKRFVADKYPLILTEVGFLAPDESGGYNPIIGDESYGTALTSYCTQRGISYTPWCFDVHWSPTLIKDWNYTPTRQGAFFKQALPRK